MAMIIDRRHFLGAFGAAALGTLTPRRAAALALSDAVFATAFRSADGAYGFAFLATDGTVIDRHVLPGRAHGLAVSPERSVTVAFARRPGRFAAAFSPRAETILFSAPDDRHFFGHGTFSADGRLLYASEDDIGRGTGVIGIYDATDRFRRIGEFPAFGIGTHDLCLLDDGHTLIAANGGIRTDPAYGRTKLNLDRMEPGLSLIDSRHGSLVERHDMPGNYKTLSCRHTDLDAAGRIWFACQNEGAASDPVPVLGWLRPGEEARFVELPDTARAAMAGYVGAIAIDRRRGLVAIASPKGEAGAIIDTDSGALVALKSIPGVTGLAAGPDGFLFSSQDGTIGDHHDRVAWDQHIGRLG